MMGYQDDQTRKILNLIREGNVESKKQIIKEYDLKEYGSIEGIK